MLKLFSSKGICERKDFTIAFIIQGIILAVFMGIINIVSIPLQVRQICANINIYYWLLTFIPWFALIIRRLHDTNKTGLWVLLIPALPPITTCIFIYFLFKKGVFWQNQYIIQDYNVKNKNFYILIVPICLVISIVLGIIFR
ncbi:MAG: DUF805 domain-containing protein [Clostridia bacterium]|nr:DUF805 domain-containing protein [Clostridia bacterium]